MISNYREVFDLHGFQPDCQMITRFADIAVPIQMHRIRLETMSAPSSIARRSTIVTVFTASAAWQLIRMPRPSLGFLFPAGYRTDAAIAAIIMALKMSVDTAKALLIVLPISSRSPAGTGRENQPLPTGRPGDGFIGSQRRRLRYGMSAWGWCCCCCRSPIIIRSRANGV